MADLITGKEELGLRILYGRPEVVEAEIERLKDSYVVTSVFFYVVENHLEVACNLVHQREMRKAQLGAMRMPGPPYRQ
jgi:hypothetical protein